MFTFIWLLCLAFIIFKCVKDILEGIRADLSDIFGEEDDYRTAP